MIFLQWDRFSKIALSSLESMKILVVLSGKMVLILAFIIILAKRHVWQRLFRKIIGKLKRKMASERRNVVLTFDNAPVHDKTLSWSNVKLVFLPLNTASHYQPFNSDIIVNFKNHYNIENSIQTYSTTWIRFLIKKQKSYFCC